MITSTKADERFLKAVRDFGKYNSQDVAFMGNGVELIDENTTV